MAQQERNVRPMKGPGGRGPRGPRPKVENPGLLMKRLVNYVVKNNLVSLVMVAVFIVASTLGAISEGILLATQAGVDPNLVFSILRGGMSGSRMMEAKLPKIINRDFTPGFKMDLQIKDLKNALDFGEAEGVPMPMTRQVTSEMKEIAAQGHGNDDHSVLYKYYEQQLPQ